VLLGGGGAGAIDARLHGERLGPGGRERRVHEAPFDELPNGAFVLEGGAPWLVLGAELLRWAPAGYAERRPRPDGAARLITPPALVEWLRAGGEPVVPRLHPSAARPRNLPGSP
jgi:hypothetical protein